MWFTLLKDDITRDKNAAGSDILYLVVPMASSVPQKTTFHRSRVKLRPTIHLRTMDRRNRSPTLSTENAKVGDVLSLTRERLKGNQRRMATRRDQVSRIHGIGSSLCPVGMS